MERAPSALLVRDIEGETVVLSECKRSRCGRENEAFALRCPSQMAKYLFMSGEEEMRRRSWLFVCSTEFLQPKSKDDRICTPPTQGYGMNGVLKRVRPDYVDSSLMDIARRIFRASRYVSYRENDVNKRIKREIVQLSFSFRVNCKCGF